MTGIIHYYHTDCNYDKFRAEYNIFYDAGDFFSRYAPADVYRQWRQALNRAVVELRTSTKGRYPLIHSRKSRPVNMTRMAKYMAARKAREKITLNSRSVRPWNR